MDVQLKRGLLDVCVLRALRDKDSYGYQIIKDVSPYISITESTLYPILKRLEAASYVEVYSVEYNSRLRKYYRITNGGIDKLEEFKNEWNEIMKVYEFISSSSMYEVDNQVEDDMARELERLVN